MGIVMNLDGLMEYVLQFFCTNELTKISILLWAQDNQPMQFSAFIFIFYTCVKYLSYVQTILTQHYFIFPCQQLFHACNQKLMMMVSLYSWVYYNLLHLFIHHPEKHHQRYPKYLQYQYFPQLISYQACLSYSKRNYLK